MVRRFLAVTVCLAAALCSERSVLSQGIPGGLTRLGPALSAPVAVDGDPFGVLAAEIPLPPELADREPRVLVEDAESRVFYPVVSVRKVDVTEPLPVRGIGRRGGLIDRVRSAIRGEQQKRQVAVAISVSALYRGTGPITLNLVGDINQRIRIDPAAPNGRSHQELANQWWSRYTRSASDAISTDDFPKLVHKYLTSMLADRMGLPRVDLDPPDPEEKELSQPLETLALLAAIEPLREEILEDVLSYPSDAALAELPVPPEPAWEPRVIPPAAEGVEIESLATRVPPECFYLRFGSFSNYVWFQEISERYGGDIAQAVLLRGFNYEASERMERMLAAKMTAIAKMFGDKLIGDMAVIGSDLYMKEGASLGVLFYATNPGLLDTAMTSDRKSVAAKTDGASLQELTIAGHSVSLLSTPDNRIRSFYVQDGPYIFITTSKTLVRRFLEVGAGQPSLAATPAFRSARSWMPDGNNYSVFGYFSPEFFHRLVSPQYQIELRRRLEAIAHLEIAEVATQAGQAEGMATRDISSLIAAGLLPSWFDSRPDGARVLRSGDRWIDSLRGARSSFLPIADVELTGVTAGEAESYAEIANFYQNEWRHMDPMLVGLRRFRAEGAQAETVAFEGYLAPFEAGKYGWIAKRLAEPTPLEIGLPADDVASAQLHLRGDVGFAGAPTDYHLFAGVKDMLPPEPEDTQGLLKTLQALRAAPAYLGAWPKPGLVERLPLGLGLAQPDYAGFSRLLGGLWRWQDGQFSLLSFNRSIIENAIPQLRPQASTDLAQARLQISNLSGTQLSHWINTRWYQRGWRSSHGNTRLLDAAHQQLKVPSQQCLEVTERLLGVKLQCPIGGEYQFRPLPAGVGGWWESSAWSESVRTDQGRVGPPPGYVAPWIEWFRGGKVHVTQRPDSLAVVGTFELDMPPLPAELTSEDDAALPTMNFDLFQLPFKLFGNGDGQPEPKVQRRSF